MRFARSYESSLERSRVREIRHVIFQWSAAGNRIENSRIEVLVDVAADIDVSTRVHCHVVGLVPIVATKGSCPEIITVIGVCCHEVVRLTTALVDVLGVSRIEVRIDAVKDPRDDQTVVVIDRKITRPIPFGPAEHSGPRVR